MGTTICSRCKAWINDREWRCRSCGKLLPGLFGQRRWLDTIFSRSRSQARTPRKA
jgi:transposase